MNLTLLQLAALAFSAVLIGVSKTGVNGAVTIAIPVFALIFGAKESTGVILPMLCAADIMAVIYYRRSAAWNYIARLVPWAFLGFALALFVDKMVPVRYFRVLIGICIAGGLVLLLWGDLRPKSKRGEDGEEAKAAKKNKAAQFFMQALFGILGGFSTLIGNAAGPVMSVFLLSMRLPKESFVGTAAWFFLIINLIKVPIQIFFWHNITFQGLRLTLLLLPAIVLGAVIGVIIVKKIKERYYRILVYIMTIVSTGLLFV